MAGLTFDANNNRLYGYGKGGRVFYRTNASDAKWSASDVVDLPGVNVSDLVIDRNNPDNLYAISGRRIYQGSRTGSWTRKTASIGAEIFFSQLFQSSQNNTWVAFNKVENRFFISTDNMLNWNDVALPAGTFNRLYRAQSDELWIGGYDSLRDPVLFYSNNNGASWSQKGAAQITQPNANVSAVSLIGSDIYVGLGDLDNEPFDLINENYLYHSSDGGANFSRLNLPNSDAVINAISADQNQVYILTGSLVFHSLDKGLTWADVSPPNRRAGDGVVYISPWNTLQLFVTARARGGVLMSNNQGNTWHKNNAGLQNASPSLISTSKNILLPNRLISSSVTGEGVFISHNAGISWEDTSDNGFTSPWVDELAISPQDPDLIWGISDVGNIFSSVDGGINWSEILDPQNEGFRYGSIYALATSTANRSIVYALKNGFGIYKSTNSGNSWQYLNDSGVDYSYSIEVHPTNSNLVFSGYNPKPSENFSKIMRSQDGGENWVNVKQFADTTGVTSIQYTADGAGIFAGVTSNSGGQVWRSIDNGLNWNTVNTAFSFINVRHIIQDPNNSAHLFALLWGGGVYESSDDGSAWLKLSGLESFSDSISALAIDPTNSNSLYAGDRLSNKVFKSTDAGLTWAVFAVVDNQNRIADVSISSDGKFFYAAAFGFNGPFSGDIIRIGLNSGIETNISAGFDGVPLSMLALGTNKIIAAGHGRYVYSSSNQGDTWTKLNVTLDDSKIGFFNVVKHPIDESTLFLIAGDDRAEDFSRNNVSSTIKHTIWKSIDAGSTWSNLNLNQGAPLRDLAISSDGNTFVTVGMNNQIRISEDAGVSWSSVTMPFDTAGSVKITGNKTIVVGMLGGGIWNATWTSTSALTWNKSQLNVPIKNIQILTHPNNPSTLYATAYPGGVYRSQDNGATWVELNDGLPTVNVSDPERQGYYRLAIDENNGSQILLGLYGKGVFVTDLIDDIIWRPIFGNNNEVQNIKLSDILINGNSWWLASEDGIWLSVDAGNNWLLEKTNMPVPDVRILSMGENNQLIAGTRGYELYLRDAGSGWRQLAGFGNFGVRWGQWNRNLYQYTSLLFDAANENNIYIGTFPSGIYKSTDKGLTWREHNIGWTNDGVFSLIQPYPSKPEVIMAGTYNGINISEDAANTWRSSDTGMAQEQWVYSIARDPFDVSEKTLYAASKNGLALGVGDLVNNIFGSVMKTIDGGENWSEIMTGLVKDQAFYRIIADPNPGMQGTLYLATQFNGVWLTQDGGTSWTQWNTGFPAETWAATNGDNIAATMDISIDGQYLYFGTAGMGVWRRATLSHVDAIKIIGDKDRLTFSHASNATTLSSQQTLQLSAVGDLAFPMSNLIASGDTTDFTIDTSNCGTLLSAFTQCNIIVQFTATTSGNYNMQLNAAELSTSLILNGSVNYPPAANDQSFTSDEDNMLTMLADISDTDNDGLLLSILSQTKNGTITVDAAGDSFIYAPNSDYFGLDNFTYSVFDGKESTSATISLTINPINDLPVLTLEDTNAVAGSEINYQLSANDIDSDNIQFSLNVIPDFVKAGISADGKLSFVASKAGNYALVILLNDGTENVERIFTVLVKAAEAPKQSKKRSGGGGALSFVFSLALALTFLILLIGRKITRR